MIDTLILKDSISIPFPINVYQDSLLTDDVDLKWKISTAGILIDFDPELTIKRKCPELIPRKDKKWTMTAGVSNRLNWKVGIGYSNWMLESQFNKNGNFNEIYFSKILRF